MRRGALLVVAVIASVLSISVSSGSAWAATNWAVHAAAVNSGEAHALALPAAPAAPTATCTSPATNRTVKVSWTAVTHATTYAVWESTTTAGGTYTQVMSGVATTSWTTGVLSTGNYFFEVVANVGTNWAGAKSAPTAQRTLSALACS
jgi:hypothetical protein